MEAYNICQSCGMPINDPSLHGTETEGGWSCQYCHYCYQNGQFTQPTMTLEEMQYNVRCRMEDKHLPETLINTAVENLHCLNRWLQRPVHGFLQHPPRINPSYGLTI